MKRHIEKLRDKPDDHKRRFALIATSSIMVLIIGFWLLMLSIDREKQKVIDQRTLSEEPQVSESDSVPTPQEFLDTLIQVGQDGFKDISQEVQEQEEGLEEFLEVFEEGVLQERETNANVLEQETVSLEEPPSSIIELEEEIIITTS